MSDIPIPARCPTCNGSGFKNIGPRLIETIRGLPGPGEFWMSVSRLQSSIRINGGPEVAITTLHQRLAKLERLGLVRRTVATAREVPPSSREQWVWQATR